VLAIIELGPPAILYRPFIIYLNPLIRYCFATAPIGPTISPHKWAPSHKFTIDEAEYRRPLRFLPAS